MLSKEILVLAIGITLLCQLSVTHGSKNCDDSENLVSGTVDKECTTNEYSSYVDCIRKRSKRHVDCQSTCEEEDDCGGSDECGQCDCNYCSYNDCDANCQTCCSSYAPPCSSRTCCHATCQSSCRTSHCRRTCRSRCNKTIEKEKISQPSKSDTKVDVQNSGRHNITTVINLKTVVNNTNVVDMPVMVNNTNVNNITIQSPDQGEITVNMQSQPGQIIQTPQQPQQSCCNLISPRQCVPTQETPYYRCFHQKSKICGDLCQAATMHIEPHRVCENNVVQGHTQSQCHEQVAYIPQPQPRCFSTSSWPYVSCSIAKPTCGGCYTHLVQGGSAPNHCPNSCYEGGIDVGPYYRPGPYYQQQYAIPQNCQNGGCYVNPQVGMGMQPIGGMQYNPEMNNGYVESLGPTFDERSHDVTLKEEPISSTDNFMKIRRHSIDSKQDGGDSSKEAVDFKVEEFPIKMD